ncbi:glycosyltransferase [Rhizobium sp.]|uniref:glycosyltransferase family 2 protein n=1 Tax=Rhizobium sp. TaxID=391 RepID=UPI003F7E937C
MMDSVSIASIFLVVGAALLLLPMLDRDTTAGRILPCLVCEALILRTLFWRVTETLPPFGLSADVLWAYLFIFFEVLSSTSSMLLLMFLARTIDRRTEAERNRAWTLRQMPTVAVLIATYNEEHAILERTIIGAQSQDYSNFKVYVLDDGRREWLRRMCVDRGVGYIARPDNSDAKAGNLNHALRLLAEHEPSEFIAVLDADFVAQPNFLSSALPLFHDSKVACVQTPQHFFNPDPLQHGFKAVRYWPDEQRFFFDVLLASKDAWGVAFSCGTSSICRRAALDEIGAFPTESVTEDMLLSLKLKAAGWKTVYLNQQLSVGLAPEGIAEYVTQRGRWCLGFMQIARSAWGPFGSAPLPLIDRISLVDAFLYWAISFPFRIICVAAPIVYALTGKAVIDTDPESVLSHYGPSISAAFLVLVWITRGRVLPVVSDASQLLITFDGMRAAVVGFFRPKGHRFKVTPKGGDRRGVTVQWRLMARFAILLAMTLASVAYGTLSEFSPIYGEKSASIWLFWSYYNALALLVATLTCIELPRSRVEEFLTDEPVLIAWAESCDQYRVLQLSTAGATLCGKAPAIAGSEIVMKIDNVDSHIPARIVGATRKTFEVEFVPSRIVTDALIRKLFLGSYQLRPMEFRIRHVWTAIVGRIVA